jgi:hypothetical protein
MKGILKIYHPDETLKYNIKSSYCKAVFANNQHFLDIEIITDDSLDHVDDDSLQYQFPQISFSITNFPIENEELAGKTFSIEDTDEENYTEVNLYDDEDAYLYTNELAFYEKEDKALNLIWEGKIDDFYTNSEELISFKLKCNFNQEDMEVDD